MLSALGSFHAVAGWRLLWNVFIVCLLWNPKDTLDPLFAHPPGCHCRVLGPIDYSSEFSSDMEIDLCAALGAPGSGHGHLLCLWAGCTLWSCLEVWGVQSLFLSHSKCWSPFSDIACLFAPQLISLRWFVSLLQSSFSSGDIFMGLFHLSGAVFQLNTRLLPPSVQVSFYKKTHKIFFFPWTLFFGFLGSLPSLHVLLSEPCLSWLLWSTGSEAATTSWSKNGLGRVVAYTGGPLLFCASGSGE